ncbi:MAG: hypothetical protein JWM87_1334 [Candidatus Eremiobacteraeota bacterium]|nr:hypothetical protein [Candidatus Eremiobacteraeota bacterium]
MNSHTGAHRPVLKRKILWIAVTAIVLVLAWAKAGFPYPEISNPYFYMGTDGTVDGMMPPTGGPGNYPTAPPSAPPNGNANAQMRTMSTPAPTLAPKARAALQINKGASAQLLTHDVTITQTGRGRTFKYVASPNGTVQLIKRDGTPWVTVTYNKSKGTWDLTDPNGTGDLLLRLGPSVHSGPRTETR